MEILVEYDFGEFLEQNGVTSEIFQNIIYSQSKNSSKKATENAFAKKKKTLYKYLYKEVIPSSIFPQKVSVENQRNVEGSTDHANFLCRLNANDCEALINYINKYNNDADLNKMKEIAERLHPSVRELLMIAINRKKNSMRTFPAELIRSLSNPGIHDSRPINQNNIKINMDKDLCNYSAKSRTQVYPK